MFASEALLAAYTQYFCTNFFFADYLRILEFSKIEFLATGHAQVRRSCMIYALVMCTKYHKIPISGPYRPYQKHKGNIAKKKLRKTQNFFFEKNSQKPVTYQKMSKNGQIEPFLAHKRQVVKFLLPLKMNSTVTHFLSFTLFFLHQINSFLEFYTFFFTPN